MTDIPVENEVEVTKKTTLPPAQEQSKGLSLTLGNSEMIKIKLLESIQNISIRQVKILEAIASKQGINVNAIK